MNVGDATELVRDSLWLMLLLATPVLPAALVIGLLISIMQAVTPIQEQTLSFVPKIIGMAVVAILITPWVTTQIMEFAMQMFGSAG